MLPARARVGALRADASSFWLPGLRPPGGASAEVKLFGWIARRPARCDRSDIHDEEDGSLFNGAFVQDGLALFAKRLFLAAAAFSVLASLTNRQPTFARRAPEYHFTLLFSLLGMMVLVSARELVLLFVAFELMSIPLYVLTGFLKREGAAPEAALKFFLVGTVSAAVIAYGMSFMYGMMGTTRLAAVPRGDGAGTPAHDAGPRARPGGPRIQDRSVPVPHVGARYLRGGSTPFIAWLSVAPKAAGFVVIIRLYLEGAGSAALAWAPLVAMLAGVTIVAGNLMAIPQQNIKRLLAYSGVAHIGYMLHRPRGDVGERRRDGALLSGRVPVREHGRVPGRGGGGAIGAVGRRSTPIAAWRSARRCSRWRCCSSCCRSAGFRS